MGLKGVCDTFLSPLRWSAERRTTTPVPASKEGDYGAGKHILSTRQPARSRAADPWLWLAGLAVCRKREGGPLPRFGGGREGADAPAAPYKHRLAHAPGRRSRSGRAFRCVGVLGRRPKRILPTFVRTKVGPRRQAYRLKPFEKLAPPQAIFHYNLTGRGGWGAGLRSAEKRPRRKATAFSIITPPAPIAAAPHRMA